MKGEVIFILALILFGLVVVGMSFMNKSPGNTHTTTNFTTANPEERRYLQIEITLINGTRITLSRFSGKIIVIEFMNIKCPHCANYLPTFRQFHDMYKGEDIVFISISSGNSLEELRRFVKDNNVDWLVAKDTGGLGKVLKVEWVPTTIFIDKNGEIYKVLVGEQTIEALQSIIEDIK